MSSNGSTAWDKTTPVEKSAYLVDGKPDLVQSQSQTTDEHSYNLVDLFSGCGGFSSGFSQAGFKTLMGLDHHTPSCETFARNHSDATVIFGDIREVSESMFLEAIGGQHVHVITAGVPCQGFSLMNRKHWAEDERNFLFKEFIRVTRILQPDVVLLENVLGLRRTANGAFEAAIKEEIQSCGYEVSFNVLNAADYGVPQKRERVFFLGIRPGTIVRWPSPSHGPKRKKPFITVWDAIGDLPPLEAGQSTDQYISQPFTEYQRLIRGNCTSLLNHEAPNHQPAVIENIANTKPGEPMYPRFKQRIRLHPDKLSPTQVSGGIRPQFQLGHPTQARGLTVRERCRIQSFPDTYEILGGMVQGRVQTGNAVPPLLAKAIATEIMRHLVADEEIEKERDLTNSGIPSQLGFFE